jgi:hypothetical protein
MAPAAPRLENSDPTRTPALACCHPGIALLACCLAACAGPSALDRSRNLDALRNHYLAYHELDAERSRQLAAGEAVSPELERTYWPARAQFLVERGRQQIFNNQDAAALATLAAVQAIEPANAEAARLIERAQGKLASSAAARGQVLLAKGQLDAALLEFQEAQAQARSPADPVQAKAIKAAREGIEQVRAAVARLHEKAQRQFVEAIRKYPEFRYWEVDWHAGIALSSDPARNDALQLRAKAQRELAERQVANGLVSEQAGAYGAALMQYREARRWCPDLPSIDERVARMETEVKAQRLIERAAIEIMANDFAAARLNLQAAFDLSILERGAISEMMLDAKRREGEVEYAAARDNELQNRKEAALAAFEALAAKWPDGLLDEKTRIGALRSDIDNATKEYAAGEAAEASGDAKAALEHYSMADTFYPGWKDLRARIERLRRAFAPPGGT